MPELVPDVLQLVFQQLVGDSVSLQSISLTCRAWRSIALPCALQAVDISSHNNGRQPQLECNVLPMVYADYSSEYRPRNLVSRQRAFLRLMTDKPELARYVKSFTWTLTWLDIWLDDDQDELTEIDRQTWNVFGSMVNVTSLDLASLHWVDEDECVRQNPAVLFPKVRDLRLLGWMHRGLVRAIITSLEPSKLSSLKLDYLEDEGALPNGGSMGEDSAIDHAHHAKATVGRTLWPEDVNGSEVFHDDLILRQETGKAFVFPGPMWLPLHLLSAHSMASLTHLQVKVPPFSKHTDLRSYNTLFHKTANFMATTRETLKSLIIVFGECRSVYPDTAYRGGCGTPNYHRPWSIKMAKLFLEQLLAVLNENAFPQLEVIHFEGFHLLEDADPHEAARAELAGVLQLVQDTCSRFANATLTDLRSVQGRQSYHGHNRGTNEDLDRFAELLASS